MSETSPNTSTHHIQKDRQGHYLPGGPGVKTVSSQCRGLGFNSRVGNQVPYATTQTQHSKKKKKKKKLNKYFFKNTDNNQCWRR